MKLLKELVRKRLIAAADEIFGLFESTVASYEEQLYRAREESERQRQLGDVCPKAHIQVRLDQRRATGGKGQVIPDALLASDRRSPPVKEEEEAPRFSRVKEEVEEADISEFPLKVVVVKSEDEQLPGGSSPRNLLRVPSGERRREPQAHKLFSLLSNTGDTGESLSNADCQGDGKRFLPSENDSTERRCGTDQDPQSPLIKEEEEQVDVSNKPLTVISAKSEDDELCRRSRGAAAADNLLAPLSHSEDTEESSKSGTDCEGDDKRSIKEAPKRFVCSACGERFARKSNMVTHMRVHTGDKPFCCSVCGETFARKVSLKGHAATHTGEKPFTCSVCGERFAYNYNLTRHMHTHTGDKRFACSVCGKIFNQRANMVAHLRTHTGEKPFQCTLCGDRFAHRVSLIAHTATHTGQKPFLCPVCGEGFSYKYSLTAHMRKHRQ
ncbi:zinc finger protein 134 isoform X1 [Syngnathus scovelli]|uniref:zinc finger protein 134 isoform X1 n=1 Tax=Syngnathus scovelli TaxID=161590 RepID=UPI00211036A3|nr:zinc finger and SCAN domain-containing protein 2 isoform X1 [Syngnathus scovelli]